MLRILDLGSGLPLRGLHVLPMPLCVCVFFFFSAELLFPPIFKNMYVRFIKDSKLSLHVNVSVNGLRLVGDSLGQSSPFTQSAGISSSSATTHKIVFLNPRENRWMYNVSRWHHALHHAQPFGKEMTVCGTKKVSEFLIGLCSDDILQDLLLSWFKL